MTNKKKSKKEQLGDYRLTPMLENYLKLSSQEISKRKNLKKGEKGYQKKITETDIKNREKRIRKIATNSLDTLCKIITYSQRNNAKRLRKFFKQIPEGVSYGRGDKLPNLVKLKILVASAIAWLDEDSKNEILHGLELSYKFEWQYYEVTLTVNKRKLDVSKLDTFQRKMTGRKELRDLNNLYIYSKDNNPN